VKADEVPPVLMRILDRHAGRVHSPNGAVAAALAEILDKFQAMLAAGHEPTCQWPVVPCRKFSTDGTRLGAHIAHTMGTMDERAILTHGPPTFESDVAAEQKDWEGDEQCPTTT
jgi:hypothetical protein